MSNQTRTTERPSGRGLRRRQRGPASESTLAGIREKDDDISDRRRRVLDLPRAQRQPTYETLVSEARALLDELQGIAPPAAVHALHDDALTYLVRVVDWLSLESEYVTTGQFSKQMEANDMLAEINARESLVDRALWNVRSTYRLHIISQ